MSSTPPRSNLKVLSFTNASSLHLSFESFTLSLRAAHRSERTIEYCNNDHSTIIHIENCT